MYFNYKSLELARKVQPPYRGTDNKYPMDVTADARKRSYNYFKYEQENNTPIMRVFNGKDWTRVEITKEEYDELIQDKQQAKKVRKYTGIARETYYRWDETEHELGIVRPDNTFEFTQSHYRVVEATYFAKPHARSDLTCRNDARRGGLIIHSRNKSPQYMIPIFKGLRVNCDTLIADPSREYRILSKRVDRMKANRLLQQYEEFFVVSKTMISNMPYSRLCDIGKELAIKNRSVANLIEEGNPPYPVPLKNFYTKLAFNLIKESPLEAMLAFALSENTSQFFYDATWPSRALYRQESKNITLYHNTVKEVRKQMYLKATNSVFSTVEHVWGMRFPACEWGLKILCDNQEVEQSSST